MSNKRQKDRNKIALLDLSAVDDMNSSAIVSREIQPLESQSPKGGLRARLKAHWLIVGVVAFLALGAFGAGLKYLEEDAGRQMLSGRLKTADRQNQSLLNRINPFISAPLTNPTPQLSKEYIYAGDRLLAVEDANATAVPPADLAVWRETTGGWYVMGESGVMRAAVGWGLDGDTPAAGDYDGDGKTDFCVVRPDSVIHKAKWFILRSSDGVISEVHWGTENDQPVQADYDGDGITDVAVVSAVQNPGQHTWLMSRSTNLMAVDTISFGNSTDIPEPADYDGDGKADIAVWRNSTRSFYKLNSGGAVQTVSFADTGVFNLQQTSQEPVAGDYDGDGASGFCRQRRRQLGHPEEFGRSGSKNQLGVCLG